MGIQIVGSTDTVTTTTSGGTVKVTPASVNATGVSTFSDIRITGGTISGVSTAGITTAYIGSVNDGPISGARNRIINGDMRIDQRNAGASVNGNAAFPVDRFSIGLGGSAVVSVARTTTNAPNNFTYSTSFTVSTADSSVTGSDYYTLYQRIEGNNVDDFKFGTANAKTFTLSFWVRSSVTGTYFVRFSNSAYDRSYVTSYSISSQNTWEYKTITVAGDTSGTWLTNEGMGLVVEFCLGNGTTYQTSTTNSWIAGNYLSTSSQTNWISTLNATFYLTGVQLEPGTVATPFERRSYGQELALCQRYYWQIKNTTGSRKYLGMVQAYASTATYGIVTYVPVELRGSPTVGISGGFGFFSPASSTASTTSPIDLFYSSQRIESQNWGGATGLTAGQGLVSFWENNAVIYASAEL